MWKQKQTAKRLVAFMAMQVALFGYQQDVLAQTSSNGGNNPTMGSSAANFHIPASSLFEALHAFSRQAGIPVTILPGTPDDVRSTAVDGRFSPEHALTRLMGGSTIPYRFSGGALIVGQEAADGSQAVVLQPVTVVGGVPQAVMPTENGSSGLSVLGQDMIKVIGTGDKDPMRLLRVLPNVNFDNSQFSVSQSGGTGTLSEQDLTPERVSISGGKVYDNKVLLDGMDNVSVFDVTNTNEADADKIGIHNPMALFVNSDILREVAVYDSNVPARYGGFTGGVIDMRTRDPASKFGGSFGYSRQTEDSVHYRNEWDSANSTAQSPLFTKNNYDMVVDVPVTKRLRTMFAASKAEAEQQRVATANYTDASKTATRTTKASYLASVSADVGDKTTVSLKGLYAPYTQEYTRGNMANDRQETVGQDYQVNSDLHYAGNVVQANLALGLSHSGFTRDAPSVAYTWSRTASKLATCAGGTQCVEGGYGNIAEEQDDFQAKGDLAATALTIDWSTGIDYHSTSARRARYQTNVHYFSPTTGATIVCANPADPACISGQQVLKSRNYYLARDLTVDVNNMGYWAQGEKTLPVNSDLLKSVELRGGLRADYGDYLGNLNWAPRLSTTLRFPSDVALTLGANRYYSTDTLAYALYEKNPSVITQTRVASAGNVWSENWSSPAARYIYQTADVRTPYSDERTAAVSLPLLWGEGRVKYLVRHNRDEITQESFVEGGVSKRRPTNKGWTNYKSASVEWLKNLQNHAFLINGTWSDTERNSETYFESPDEEGSTNIYYNGSVIPTGKLPVIAGNFAQPLVINAVWTSKWFEDALTVNFSGKYRFAREDIAATDNTIRVGGTTYTIYEDVTRNPQVRFDTSATYRIDTWSEQQVELFASAENIFNARSYTADADAPYERGRSYWLGARYLF